MTSTLTEPKVASPLSTRTVVFQLARFEAWRTVRHPLTWLGTLGSLWVTWFWVGGVAPVLQRDSVYLAGAILPLAGATMLVAFYATKRERQVADLLTSFSADRNVRLIGIQLGMMGPVFLAIVVHVIGLGYLLVGGPIGDINWWELAVGPLMVAALGVGGVLVGRWLPHPVVPLVTLVGLGVLQFLASPDWHLFSQVTPTASVEWLAPWMVPSAFGPVEELANRPAVLHLFYLAGLGLVLALLALRLRGRARLMQLTFAGLFVLGLVGTSIALPPQDPFDFNWPEAAAHQVCRTMDGIEYCAFEFYEEWIPHWQKTVAAVDALAPVALVGVIQRPHNIGWDDNSGVPTTLSMALTTLEWDRAGALPTQAFGLALTSAQSTVGLPTMPELRTRTPEEIESMIEQNPDYPGDLRSQLESEPEQPMSCSAIGQARGVVAVWLAGAALSDGTPVLDRTLERFPSAIAFRQAGPEHPPAAIIGRPDAALARELLDQSLAEVQTEIEARWNEVIDPSTTSTEMASWFGLQAPVYSETDYAGAPCS